MSLTVEQVRSYLFIIASEFTTTDETELSKIDTLITQSLSTHNENLFGNDYLDLIAYHVAYKLNVSGFTPAESVSVNTQQVSKKKVGNIEISYSTASKTTQAIKSTIEGNKYGSEYLRIKDNVIIAPRHFY